LQNISFVQALQPFFLLFLEYIFIAKQDYAKTKTPSLQLKWYLDNDKPI